MGDHVSRRAIQASRLPRPRPGELYDLEDDLWEFENLWDDPGAARVKSDLIYASFDAHVLLTTDVGSRRIAPI